MIVSHKVSSVRHCDLIVVLEDGRIAEQGSHAELILRQGHYAAIYDQQTRALMLSIRRLTVHGSPPLLWTAQGDCFQGLVMLFPGLSMVVIGI